MVTGLGDDLGRSQALAPAERGSEVIANGGNMVVIDEAWQMLTEALRVRGWVATLVNIAAKPLPRWA